MNLFNEIVWVISDFLILVGTFYVALFIIKAFLGGKIQQILAAVVVSNFLVPYVAEYFDTPLVTIMKKFGLPYSVPITAVSVLVFISAFLFSRNKIKK